MNLLLLNEKCDSDVKIQNLYIKSIYRPHCMWTRNLCVQKEARLLWCKYIMPRNTCIERSYYITCKASSLIIKTFDTIELYYGRWTPKSFLLQKMICSAQSDEYILYPPFWNTFSYALHILRCTRHCSFDVVLFFAVK